MTPFQAGKAIELLESVIKVDEGYGFTYTKLNPLAAQARELLAAIEKPPTDDELAFIQAARDEWASDEIEIDDDPIVSEGDDGAFVAAWVYVTNEQAGLACCPDCGGEIEADRRFAAALEGLCVSCHAA